MNRDDPLAVEAYNIVKVFNKSVRALDGVSLSIEAGEVRAILGPNGAGKTTLMRILTTQIPASSGYALVFGYDVSREGHRVRELIGYVPQEFSVWTDLTGYENLLIYAKLYRIPKTDRDKLIMESLDFMGLYDDRNRLVKTYSGGMIRRLEIAVALMLKPKILFLDEPTIGLDPRARELVWKRLLEYRREYGSTIVFNTHYMDEAENYAEKITLLNRGRVIAEGDYMSLKKYSGVLDKIVVKVNDVEKAVKIVNELGYGRVLKTIDNEVMLEAVEPPKILPQLIEALAINGLEVYEASIARSGLNEVFIKLTGMTIEEAERAMGVRETRAVRRAIKRGG